MQTSEKIISEIEKEAVESINQTKSLNELREVANQYVGSKGKVSLLMREIGKLPQEERPNFGKAVNDLKEKLSEIIEQTEQKLRTNQEKSQAEKEKIDLTMPGRKFSAGQPHIISQTFERIKRALIGLGFEYFEGKELEEVKYNFTALNYPPDHPAMDDQDTFYIDDEKLLRTQCTAFQGRVFEMRNPPFRAFTIGRCFRNEAVDRTHSHTFHQVDAFMVDEGVSMAHHKGTLGAFARAMFGSEVHVRFRPDFFPFVEPGVDYAITCPFCSGKGCSVCKKSGWIELGGAGLVHPNILQNYGIDTDRFSGFAFGLGVERIPMMQYQIDDLRLFMENDLRFLEQFPS